MSATQLTGRQIKNLGGDISGQGNAVSVDKIKGTPISATAPTTGQSLVFNGTSWTPTNGAGGSASALVTTGADVVVSGAPSPTAGQVLTAINATTANWQTPSGGGSNPYTGSGAFVQTNAWQCDDGAVNANPDQGGNLNQKSIAYDGTNLWCMSDFSSVVKIGTDGVVVARYTFVSTPTDFIYAFGFIWLLDGSNTMYKVDASTGATVASYTSGQTMNRLTANATYIFVSPSILRFDPATGMFNNVQNVSEASAPHSIATDGASTLWIIDQSSAIVRRVGRDLSYSILPVFNTTWTAVADGTAGNAVTIQYATQVSGAPVISVVGSAVLITITNNVTRQSTIVNAVNNDPSASLLVTGISSSPNSANDYASAPYHTPQSLAGGVDHQLGTIDVSASGLPVAGTYANSFLWVTMNNGDLLQIDPVADSIIATFPSGASALGGITNDGNSIYVVETAPNNKIRTFDFSASPPFFVDLVTTGNTPSDVVWDGANNLWSIDRSSATIKRLSPTSVLLGSPSTTGYGLPRRGVFASGFLWVVTSDGHILKIDPATDAVSGAFLTGAPVSIVGPTNLTGGVDAASAAVDIQGGDTHFVAVATGYGGNAISIKYTPGAVAGAEVVSVGPDQPGTAIITYSGAYGPTNDIVFDGVNMWVANNFSASVTKITPTGVATTYGGLFIGPLNLAYDGTHIWAVADSSYISKISQTGAVTNIYPGGGNGIAYDGANMWITRQGAHSVSKLDANGQEIIAYSTNGGLNPRGIAFDGVNMWTANLGNDSVTKITPAGVATTYYGTGAGPIGIAFDGVNMWTANNNGNSVSKITPGGVITTYTGTGLSPQRIVSDGTDMWTADVGGQSVTRITSAGVVTIYPNVSPTGSSGIAFDGTHLWISNNGSVTVIASNVAGPSTAISIQIEDGVSTAAQVASAVVADVTASALVTATAPNPANAQSTASTPVPVFLTGGVPVSAASLTQALGDTKVISYVAATPGAAGNAITVEYTGGGTAGAEIVTVVGNAISVQIEDLVSKAQPIVSAVNAYPAASALVTASTTSVIATNLSGITQTDGASVYVSEPAPGNRIYKFNLSGFVTDQFSQAAGSPDDIAWNTGGYIWSLDLTSTDIQRLNTSGAYVSTVNVAPDGGLPRRLGPMQDGGTLLWVTMDTGHLLKCDGTGPVGISRIFDVGSTDLTGITDAGGNYIYVTATGAFNVLARFQDGRIINPNDLQDPADRIRIAGLSFLTTDNGDPTIRRVSRMSNNAGDTSAFIDISANGIPKDLVALGAAAYASLANGKMLQISTGLDTTFPTPLVIGDLTYSALTVGASWNYQASIMYVGGAPLGTASVLLWDGFHLIVSIANGVTTAQTVANAVNAYLGTVFATVTGTGSAPQSIVQQTFFTGGGDSAMAVVGEIDSGKSSLGGLGDVSGWGFATGFTSPSNGYLHFIASGLAYGNGFYANGVNGASAYGLVANATDVWFATGQFNVGPSRVSIASSKITVNVFNPAGNGGGRNIVIAGGYVYFDDDSYPRVYQVDMATNLMIKRINLASTQGGNNWAYDLGLYSDGTSVWATSVDGNSQYTSVAMSRIVSGRVIHSIDAIQASNGSYNSMVRIGDALFLRADYKLDRFNVNLG